MPAATAFVRFMDSEGSRLIEAQVDRQMPIAAAKTKSSRA
jgi:hypothetical protein